MDGPLIWAALLLGAAGTPHCAAMCGPACLAVAPPGRPAARWTFHATRLAGYAAAGAVVSSSMAALAQWGQASAVVRPLWTLVHAAALALGLWLLVTARQPRWLEQLARADRPSTASGPGQWTPLQPAGALAVRATGGVWRAGLAGAVWVGWPCGLLQSALLTAALASGPVAGAAVMASFGAASAAGLWVAPWLFAKSGRAGSWGAKAASLTTRLAGAVLALASAWALWRVATGQVFCLPPA